MEVPLKVDPVFLLQLKGRSPDLFYKIVAELGNDDLIQLCSLSSDFQKICGDNQFWERLWRMKFKETPPKKVKEEYLKRNLLQGIAGFIFEHRKRNFFLGDTREDIMKNISRISSQMNKDIWRTTFNKPMLTAIEFNNSDMFLYALTDGSLDMKEIYDIERFKRTNLVERIFVRFPLNQLVNFFPSLVEVVRIPRLKDKCSFDLVKEKLKNKIDMIKSELKERGEPESLDINDLLDSFLQEIQDAIYEAYLKGCEDVIEYLITQVESIDLRINERSNFNRHIAEVALTNGDLERFMQYSKDLSPSLFLEHVRKEDRDELVNYFIKKRNFDLPETLINLILSDQVDLFLDYLPYLDQDDYDQLRRFISLYRLDFSYTGPKMVTLIISNLKPSPILEKVLFKTWDDSNTTNHSTIRLKKLQNEYLRQHPLTRID